jgi:hypothetical protein
MASRAFRRLLSSAAAPAGSRSLVAIEVDALGNTALTGVRVGSGGGLLSRLHPRDAPLLERTGSFGDTPATLTSRPGVGLIARFQACSAVIGERCALVMDAHRASPKAAAGALAASVAARRRGASSSSPSCVDALASSGGTHPAALDDSRAHAVIDAEDVDDFPLRALECVLEEATGYYHAKTRRLAAVADHCLGAITEELRMGQLTRWGPGADSQAGFQRLLPLRRAMTELESDVREALHAITDAMKSDERVDALLPPARRAREPGDETKAPVEESECAAESARRLKRRRVATVALLQTHLWRVRAAGGHLAETWQRLEATREVWELHLDGVRNKVVLTNLHATVSTLALTVAAVPASLLGMTVPNGLEAAPPLAFWSVAAGLGAASLATWWSFMARSSALGGGGRGGRLRGARAAADLAALRFVLRSMDDLDDVMRDRRRPTESKEELVDALRAARRRGGFPAPVREEGEAEGEEDEASKGDDARTARMRRMADDAAELDAESLDLLFRVFDRDGDGRIDAEREWAG